MMHAREFAKEYEKLCYRNSRFSVWQDFVWMAACAISNSVDARFAEQREETYKKIIEKYTPEEQETFPYLFNLIVQGMETNPEQDFLGELYMQLNLGNDRAGQFFSPYHVCVAMARMSIDSGKIQPELQKQGYISCYDCACGAGATLVAAANVLHDLGINYQQHAIFAAQDIDSTTALMCYIQLSLLGCPGYVHIGDTLREPMTGHTLFGDESENTWYTPMFFADIWNERRLVHNMDAVLKRSKTFAPPKSEQPKYTFSTKKKNAGQMSFNFDGV